MMNKKLLTCLSISIVLALMACTSGKDSKETEVTNLEGMDYLVTIKTDYGEMKAVLHDLTPLHKENFIKLANEKFFDSLLFHRIIPGFMIQGGDPLSKYAQPGQRLGGGDPGYTIEAEITPELFHKKGALAAARKPNREKRSSGSQFYIVQGQVLTKEQVEFNEAALRRSVSTLMRDYPEDSLTTSLKTAFEEGGQQALFNKCKELEDGIVEKTGINFMLPPEQVETYATIGGTPMLDGEYTVFGQVISGLDVLDTIINLERSADDRPLEDARMYVTVEEMPRSEIASKYSYTDFQ